ncbi:hypothetical protein C8R44DRAFT_865144 [Mycena epipterygia]|nr:hypothetical protein C8R44DRAFT_865144 [Mycena epipterygia]
MECCTSQLAPDHADFLHDSPTDWPACALVSVPTSILPSYIFRHIAFVNVAQAESENQLDINATGNRLSLETFLAICTVPFTHLEGASVAFNGLKFSSESALALRQLLSLPTLRRVTMKSPHTEVPVFLQTCDHCSPSLRHHLSIFINIKVLGSRNFLPAVRMIEVLDLAIHVAKPPINLAAFRTLVIL